jgi:2-amino-4-hydroxy-6-hydroxymethyldihydropteridine diphosphokinase
VPADVLPAKHRVVIGLGANLGDSIANLEEALRSISALPGVEPVAVSSLYSSAPAYYEDQDTFVNAVCVVNVTVAPLDLLHALQQIEQDLRRVRSFKNAPRTLDVDVVDYEGVVSDDPELLLPHPLAFERDFVLAPLREISPSFVFADGTPLVACEAMVGQIGEVLVPREELSFR